MAKKPEATSSVPAGPAERAALQDVLLAIRVLSPVDNGIRHEPGAELELPAAEARALVGAGAAELIPAAE